MEQELQEAFTRPVAAVTKRTVEVNGIDLHLADAGPWFLLAESPSGVLPADDWAFYSHWAWNNAAARTPTSTAARRPVSPGALVAGPNWYRANIDPAALFAADRDRFSLASVTCPTMGIWSSDDFALTEPR